MRENIFQSGYSADAFAEFGRFLFGWGALVRTTKFRVGRRNARFQDYKDALLITLDPNS